MVKHAVFEITREGERYALRIPRDDGPPIVLAYSAAPMQVVYVDTPSQFEQARDAVIAALKPLRGEQRYGACLALNAILDAMNGTSASAPRFRCISAGEYDDTMECTRCGYRYTNSADASPSENEKRSQHVCPPTSFSSPFDRSSRLHTGLPGLDQIAIDAMSFQQRVDLWLHETLGAHSASNVLERCKRFLEESCELVQTLGLPQSTAHRLVDYVYARPIGAPSQELGGVCVTLAALANANSLNVEEAAERELARCHVKRFEILAKDVLKKQEGV